MKNFDPKKVKIDKKSCKNILTYYSAYMKMVVSNKDSFSEKVLNILLATKVLKKLDLFPKMSLYRRDLNGTKYTFFYKK